MNHIPEIIKIQGSRSSKCKCTPKCTEYYRIDDYGSYCKNGMQQLAISILNQVNGTMIAQKNLNNRGWTTKQEAELIKFIEQNGVQFGTYRILAEMFGKSRAQVKSKVYKLEKEGRLIRNPSK